MDILDDFISPVDAMLDSRRKRHITGGILLSAALLFGGLAITVVTDVYKRQVQDGSNGRVCQRSILQIWYGCRLSLIHI